MELEAVEKSLREQLESRDPVGASGSASTLAEKLQAAEREITELKVANADLEESEEILKENWSRVADEDASRIMCLEEKVEIGN